MLENLLISPGLLSAVLDAEADAGTARGTGAAPAP